jgi:hypothetical protein
MDERACDSTTFSFFCSHWESDVVRCFLRSLDSHGYLAAADSGVFLLHGMVDILFL